MTLTLTAILTAARTPRAVTPCPACGEGKVACSCAGKRAVAALCKGLTDADLSAEIESVNSLGWVFAGQCDRAAVRDCYAARAALETERDRRRLAALDADGPERQHPFTVSEE